MNLNRLFISLLLMVMSMGCVNATETDDIQKRLEHAQGKEKLELLSRLFEKSLEGDDFDLMWYNLQEFILEAKRQGNKEKESDARFCRIELFYNYDLNDSIFQYVEEDMAFIHAHGTKEKFFETWASLVNTYVYSGSLATGLKEAEKMYEQAKEEKNEFGTGLACYVMGNAYYNMNNLDEASDVYRRGIDILMQQSPVPLPLADLFASECDVLEKQERYADLEKLTVPWNEFLEQFRKEKGLSKYYPGTFPNWAYYYLGCAQAALGLGKLEKADEMLEEARVFIPSEDSPRFRSWLYYRIRYLMKLDFYPEALLQSDHLVALHDGVGDMAELVRVKQQRAEILTHLGRHAEAAQLYNEMYQINDSINTSDTKRQLAEMNTKYALDEERMKHAEEQMRSIIAIAVIIVLSLAIFLYFRIRSARRLKKAHESLEQAHGKLEETHQQLLTAYDQLEETTAAKERIESDLRIARNIQMSMVPSLFPERDDLDLFASMSPAKEVGGDLYGYLLLGDLLYFCLGDVSGKGVPASLFMAQATRLFRTLAAQKKQPAEIATQINDALSGDDNEQGMFVTMFIGLVDLTTGNLHFCNAGHNPPVLIDDGKTEFLEMIPNLPIGLMPEFEYEGEEIADISNKPLFVYTDGLNEAENRQQDQFTDERLLEILETTPFESSRQTIELLASEVEKHRDGADPNDDLTMLCVKVIRNNE
jgi:serine phosphatase RsbU (regulator of sigma subunit)